MARTELLTYIMERHEVTTPPLGAVESLAKNAPSIVIGERLAADKLRLAGCRLSHENPLARNLSSDHRSDCVPVSAPAEIFSPLTKPRLQVLPPHVASLSTVTVIKHGGGLLA